MRFRSRLIVTLCLMVVVVLAFWLTSASGQALMQPAGVARPFLLFVMWFSMMAAMMLPSALPAILLFQSMNLRLASAPGATLRLIAFVCGYLAVWAAFSLATTLLQTATRDSLHMTGMMAITSEMTGAILLLAAGAWQLTPLKQSCLSQCQTPFHYLSHNWRKGWTGAFRMGLGHGFYCLGCCWVLMGLLFYGGVMEPLWIIGLAAYVAVEKLVPQRTRISHLAGLILILWGGVTLALVLT